MIYVQRELNNIFSLVEIFKNSTGSKEPAENGGAFRPERTPWLACVLWTAEKRAE